MLDKLRNGYSFGSDDFEEDDDDFDVSIGNTTGGSSSTVLPISQIIFL